MEPWKNLIKSGIASRGNERNKREITSRITDKESRNKIPGNGRRRSALKDEREMHREKARRETTKPAWDAGKQEKGEWRKAHIDKQGIQAQNEKK